ncbi:dolichyl-P-Man:Man(5)GlcNAc(2)-PP-dolichol alpha-1,3-mannosyltransferase [Spiromyces aspiralis]|uniref:Dolichyl-P-Man:Man(5)GlcNAc(2)-PP-dolichol alpha-1,3-mannosyltransferase n=1 Tax=Spiromyces aspiralis TaxID=68401 RepID=A0ACC1HDU5_9FUNG|nr:dolichyl-P-Man:Man(5)GlcNAc(2)-PP-dolichol alpha-1,3-mannosyltransferase [Spiromyces aspiralis]
MALKFARRILVDSRCFYWVAVPLMVFELALNILIVSKVPYTEIDWKTYMQQIAAVVEGERNYSLIRGDTGPLVYPAGFVWIYRCLYWLTEGGTNIFRGQLIFIGIYMFNFLIVMCIYRHSSKASPRVRLLP